MEYNVEILVLFFTFIGVWIGIRLSENKWKTNANHPQRLCIDGKFYKVVQLDCPNSWDLCLIHEDQNPEFKPEDRPL